MKGTIKINADLSCRHAPERVYAKQGDINSRFIRADFFFGGYAFDMSAVSRSEIRVRKPDGKITVNDGVLTETGAIFPLTDQSLSVAGKGSIDLMLYGNDGSMISCVPAELIIISVFTGDSAIASTNEFKAFREQTEAFMRQINEFNEDYTQKLSDFGGRIDAYGETNSRLESEVDSFGTEISSLNTSISELENTVKTLNTNALALGARVNTLENGAKTTEGQISSLDSRLTVLENGFGSSGGSSGSADPALVQRVSELEETVGGLESRAGEIENSVSGLESKAGDIEKSVNGLQSDSDELSKRADTLETQMTSANKQLSADKEAISGMQSTLDGLSYVVLTQAEYDALESKTAMFYLIKEEE